MPTQKPEIIVTVSAFFVFFLVWEIISTLFFKMQLFPPPSKILEAFFESLVEGEFVSDLLASATRITMGLILGTFFGVIFGVLTAKINLVNLTFGQIGNFARNIPFIALVPLTIVWFGISEASKIFVISLGVFFPVWISSHEGIKQTSKHYIWTAKSLGATQAQLLKHVDVPSALSPIISGMRIAISNAFFAMAAAEIVGGSFAGLGYRIAFSQLIFRVDKMLAGIVAIGFLGLAVDMLYVRITKKTFPWLQRA